MDSKYYITIGRQLGAGGLEIAKKLSAIFGIPVFDKELIEIASKESGLCPEVFEHADETPRNSSRGLFGLLFSEVAYNNLGNRSVLDEAELFRIQSEVIRDIASKQSAIFVGRCADYILRDKPNCINIFITANDTDRVARLRLSKKMDGFKELSDSELAEYMHKADKKRAEYYNYYTYKDWGHSSSYNICLDSSFLGTGKCAEIIANHIRERFHGQDKQD